MLEKDEDVERALFEAWCTKDKSKLTRSTGIYKNLHVSNSWHTWKTRASLSPIAGEVHDLVHLLNALKIVFIEINEKVEAPTVLDCICAMENIKNNLVYDIANLGKVTELKPTKQENKVTHDEDKS